MNCKHCGSNKLRRHYRCKPGHVDNSHYTIPVSVYCTVCDKHHWVGWSFNIPDQFKSFPLECE